MAREVNKRKRRKSSTNTSSRQTVKKTNHDITAVIIIAVGILIGISMFTTWTGPLGALTSTLLMGLFGKPAYILCFALIACSIHYIAKKELGKYRLKYILTSILVVCLSVFWHIVENADAERLG